MSKENPKGFQEVFVQMSNWLEEVKRHEVTKMVEFVEQAKLYAKAAEALPEERVGQFIENLKFDLSEFYQHWQSDREHSIYLGLMNESWWATLAEMTDKSQVEWAELSDDFAHDGVYKAGDFIGFGELECKQCHQVHLYTHFSEVLECTECGHNQFGRKAAAPQ
ncbi:zinc ribbon-containing protein [Thalassotalea atypica]|uniref:zinc ribbon-containing protein n=1 Tax=Thalassotalea atypica TaxID=2054316 RepID=UPI0025728D3B|nr:hypothetical protein [Thalassotalea atypica]